MTTVLRQALVPYTNKQMFALVDDIASYPQFLPWCRATTVHQRSLEEVCASIELNKGPVSKSFTTRNLMHPFASIEIHLLEGPFRKLEGCWSFHAISLQECKIVLELEFEFSNRLAALVLESVFNRATNTLVDAFVARAQVVYP